MFFFFLQLIFYFDFWLLDDESAYFYAEVPACISTRLPSHVVIVIFCFGYCLCFLY